MKDILVYADWNDMKGPQWMGTFQNSAPHHIRTRII